MTMKTDDDIVSEVKKDCAEEDTEEEFRGGSSEIETKIMEIERNLESVYWASNRKQMKISDYCTRI
jgi:hypothetical protein